MENKIEELIKGFVEDVKELGADVNVVKADCKSEDEKEDKEGFVKIKFKNGEMETEINEVDTAELMLVIHYLATVIAKNQPTPLTAENVLEAAKELYPAFKKGFISMEEEDHPDED